MRQTETIGTKEKEGGSSGFASLIGFGVPANPEGPFTSTVNTWAVHEGVSIKHLFWMRHKLILHGTWNVTEAAAKIYTEACTD